MAGRRRQVPRDGGVQLRLLLKEGPPHNLKALQCVEACLCLCPCQLRPGPCRPCSCDCGPPGPSAP
eukprot:9268931-Pyramimonas_sp.AAC.1